MNIAIFGGTFDPIHTGHLIIAEFVREEFDIGRIYFIPARIPPHKEDQLISPPEVRLEMLAAALKNNPHFKLSEMELNRKGVSYTVDTLRDIRTSYPPPRHTVSLLMGGDNLISFNTWHRPEEIHQMARILVYPRPGSSLSHIGASLLDQVSVVNGPALDISSRYIRTRVAAGQSIRYLVPPEVEKIITRRRLYRTAD